METTRRGFFGLVAGALASVPVLKRLPLPRTQFPKYMTLGGLGAIAPYTRVQIPDTLYSFDSRGRKFVIGALPKLKDQHYAS